MIVYRQADQEELTSAKLGRIAGRSAPLDALVELGELEQGVLDAARPTADTWADLEEALNQLLLAAAQALLDGSPAARSPMLPALSRLRLPPTLRVRPPEGYVHYALDPLAYAAAARRYQAAAGGGCPVVVGVRSIGTSLSAVVAAALGTHRRLTVRVRGQTGARRVVADGCIEQRLLGRGPCDVLVVDEGPGATGETLAAVAEWLRGLGVPDERVVLFPSHTGGMALAPPERRAWFVAARMFPPDLVDPRPTRLGLEQLEDLSAGRWRQVVPGASDAVACVGHERRKYRGIHQGRLVLARWAGLGGWGERTVQRAVALAEAGMGPSVRAVREGFLICDWTPGELVHDVDAAVLDGMQRYLVGRASLFRTGLVVDVQPILRMLVENATEALGNPPGLAAAVRALEALPGREAVIADARLQRRKWLRGPDGLVRKVDAIDHGDGLRLPGPIDLAWDLAAAAIELDLPPAALERLTQRCAVVAGDQPAELARAVAAYQPAVAAFALGDACLSAWEAGDEVDRGRLEREAAGYRAILAGMLGC